MFILLIFFGKGLYMEFIEKISEGKYKIKSEESTRKYLIQTCKYFNILESFSDDIIINVNSVGGIEDEFKIKQEGLKITKFIYCIGLQMLILLELNLSIKYFDEYDFIYVNKDIFLFVNYNKLFSLLTKDKFKEKTKFIDYKYGIINNVNESNKFLSPEVKRGDKIIYYTNMYYSFALLIQKIFDFKIEDIYYTKTYFFLERCLKDNPFEREFMYV